MELTWLEHLTQFKCKISISWLEPPTHTYTYAHQSTLYLWQYKSYFGPYMQMENDTLAKHITGMVFIATADSIQFSFFVVRRRHRHRTYISCMFACLHAFICACKCVCVCLVHVCMNEHWHWYSTLCLLCNWMAVMLCNELLIRSEPQTKRFNLKP